MMTTVRHRMQEDPAGRLCLRGARPVGPAASTGLVRPSKLANVWRYQIDGTVERSGAKCWGYRFKAVH